MDYRHAMQLLRDARLFAPSIIRKDGAYHVFSRMEHISSGATIQEALDAGGFLNAGHPPASLFVAVNYNVVEGNNGVAVARSKTMAQRIAAALNEYIPGMRGF